MVNDVRNTFETSTELASHTNASGVSWGAIFAGAAAAAALSLILLILGFGLGLSSVSPWAYSGASASTMGVATIVWLSLTQILASGMGGYLSGRLRIKWASVHTDEVYFRDTAHGFLAWAVASLVTAAFLASAISAALGGAIDAGASVAKGGAALAAGSAIGSTANANHASGKSEDGSEALGYFVDALFRANEPAPGPSDPAIKVEAGKIFFHDLYAKDLPATDKQYLAQLVSKRTGLSQSDAEIRVADIFNRTMKSVDDAKNAAKEAADKARKAAAYSALWMFIALLCGAFFASLAATFGGRQRDNVPNPRSAAK